MSIIAAAEPPRVLTPANKIYQVIKNHRALIDCASFGSPIPKITWWANYPWTEKCVFLCFLTSSNWLPLCLRFKESRSSTLDGDPYIIHDNGTLEIPSAQVHNGGKYTCAARNILGIYENHVYLEVKGERASALKKDEEVITRLVLQCHVIKTKAILVFKVLYIIL